MVTKEFFLQLETLEKELKISKELFMQALEAGFVAAYNKDFDSKTPIEFKLNPDKYEFRVFARKNIVDEVTDFDKEISLEEAKKVKLTCKVGTVLQVEVTPKHFSRQATQTCIQVVKQRINDALKLRIEEEMKEKIGNISMAIIRGVDAESVQVEMVGSQLSAVMGKNDTVKTERYLANKEIKVLVKSVKAERGGHKIYVSRRVPEFVEKLFEAEVPEIKQGIVAIRAIVREAGNRTKMAVSTDNEKLDPVGACIGPKGTRINAVVAELGGEKIDIIRYDSDPETFVRAALSPATVAFSQYNELDKSIVVYVNDDKLSLAIGKDGQNVRLAARLTGLKIDIKPTSIFQEEMDRALDYAEALEAEALAAQNTNLEYNIEDDIAADANVESNADTDNNGEE